MGQYWSQTPSKRRQLEYDPARDPSIQDMRAKFRSEQVYRQRAFGDTGKQYKVSLSRNIRSTQQLSRERSRPAEVPTRSRPWWRMSSWFSGSGQPRRLLQPQDRDAEPEDHLTRYNMARINARKNRKQEWRGMEGRRVFQRSPLRVQETNQAIAKRQLLTRRYYTEKGFAKAPSFRHAIKPVAKGISTGLPLISEGAEVEPHEKLCQYFPPTFQGYRPRMTDRAWPQSTPESSHFRIGSRSSSVPPSFAPSAVTSGPSSDLSRPEQSTQSSRSRLNVRDEYSEPNFRRQLQLQGAYGSSWQPMRRGQLGRVPPRVRNWRSYEFEGHPTMPRAPSTLPGGEGYSGLSQTSRTPGSRITRRLPTIPEEEREHTIREEEREPKFRLDLQYQGGYDTDADSEWEG